MTASYKLEKNAIEEAVKLREEGNSCFRKGDSTKAIELYTQALSFYSGELQKDDDLHSTLLKNRAACYNKLLCYNNSISDCDKVISVSSRKYNTHHCSVIFCVLSIIKHLFWFRLSYPMLMENSF